MPGPFTPNAGFIVPNTGALVDTWGSAALNPDYVAIDGMLCGVQSVSVSNLPVTLTSPDSFTPTPGAGPTQSQNRVLRFTGVLTADVTVTLPIPGSYLAENLTTGNFNLILRGVTATEVIALPPGEPVEIYNDGANVRFVGLGRIAKMEHWAGISSMPIWVGGCTKKPYLICSGSTIYNFSDYPYLGPRMGSAFGGNGITTFGVPDMAGRVPLAYDSTGARITTAGCGLNGQTMGATLDEQTVTLVRANLPNTSVTVTINDPGHNHNTSGPIAPRNSGGFSGSTATLISVDAAAVTIQSATTNITASFNLNGNVTQTAVHNVQPTQVTGIWVIRAG